MGVGPLDALNGVFDRLPQRGVDPETGGITSSAPLRRKPSKRPEIRMSHSSSLMAESVARTW